MNILATQGTHFTFKVDSLGVRSADLSAAAAALSAANSHTSEINSKESEVNAKESETNSFVSETNAKESEVNSLLSETHSLTSETNSKISETNSKSSEISAAISAASAFGAAAPAYNAATTYNFPAVVAGTDGYTYRCTGTGIVGQTPQTSINWVRITMAYGDFFDVDEAGDYMPSINPKDSEIFLLDENGDISPQ